MAKKTIGKFIKTSVEPMNFYDRMEQVARENYKNWGFKNEDEAFLHILNDNTYNYKAFYNKYPNSNANADTHWTDEFKTAFHPTFSNESVYSNIKSQYNPNGYQGGQWFENKFVPTGWQKRKRSLEKGGNNAY